MSAQFFQVPGGISGAQVKVARLSMADDVAATLRVVGQVVEDTTAFFLRGRVPGLE